MHGLTIIYPWVAETVQALRVTGRRLGIVSSKYRYRIERILAEGGLASHFEVIVGGEDVSRHKPDPAGLLLALQRLGLPAADVLYVGDHPVDAEAAELECHLWRSLPGLQTWRASRRTLCTAFLLISPTCPVSCRCLASPTVRSCLVSASHATG